MIIDALRYRSRQLLVSLGILAALIGLACAAALVLHASHGTKQAATQPPPPAASTSPSAAPQAQTASDVASWNALTAITPATSRAFPAVSELARRDPSAYAAAFADELFTRNYRTAGRGALLSWVQYEDSPLRSGSYPKADWSKVLVDSLTDLTWDQATDTPIPADGVWLALSASRTTQTVRDLSVSTDPQWEAQIAKGYEPPDPLATVRDVSLTLIQRTPGAAGGTTRYEVSLDLQLGSGQYGGYGVAAANNYVITEVS